MSLIHNDRIAISVIEVYIIDNHIIVNHKHHITYIDNRCYRKYSRLLCVDISASF